MKEKIAFEVEIMMEIRSKRWNIKPFYHQKRFPDGSIHDLFHNQTIQNKHGRTTITTRASYSISNSEPLFISFRFGYFVFSLPALTSNKTNKTSI